MRTDKHPLAAMALPLGSPAPGVSLQDWLYQTLREAILAGRLAAGSKLPGSRALAEQHGLARGTVQAAYQQLLSEGYVQTRVGSGTRVSTVMPDNRLTGTAACQALQAATSPARSAPDTGWLTRLEAIAPVFSRREVTPGTRPFFPMRGDVNSFPIDLWRKLHIQQLRNSRLAALLDADPAGLYGLREAIAQYLGVARGVQVSAANILVLSSVQQGIDLCLRLLMRAGDQAWMEDPGYPGTRQLMEVAGCEVVDIPVDSHGLCVEQGLRRAPNARLAYVTPSRQAPTGTELSPSRRVELLRWASDSGAYIIEDDYDSEYRFIAKPIPALRSMASAEGSVILAGTFSKLLFPSIRLAYLVLPTHLVEPFTRAAALTARHPNSLSQAVLCGFFEQGHFDRHIRRMRKLYALRAEALSEAALRYWRGLIEVPEIRAGLDIACPLLVDDPVEACQRIAQAGVDVLPLSLFSKTAKPAGLLLGFAPYQEQAIFDAARVVRDAIVKRFASSTN